MSLKKGNDKSKDFWGPRIWKGMHVISTYVNSKTKSAYSELWWALTILLPCDKCRGNLKKKLIEYEPKKYGDNNNIAFYHSYVIHDLANQHISKYHPSTPKISPPFDEIKEWYFTEGKKQHINLIYDMLYVLSTTYQQENAVVFINFIKNINKIISNTVFIDITIDKYARNNHDLFFWCYLSYMKLNSKKKNVEKFNNLKSLYFNALGEECKDCKT